MMTGRRDLAVFWTRLEEVSSPFRPADAGVFALILSFGALQFFLYQRSSDFYFDDVFVADCARSLLQHGFYGIAGRPETNQPPGTAAILAVVCLLGGCSHAAYLRVMAVFSTLGFLATYELLRHQVSRAVAASVCLLLFSSQIYFSLATQWVLPCFPYFFANMSALLAAKKFENATSTASRARWGILLTALVGASLMVASAAIALLVAMVASISADFLRHRPEAASRLKRFLPIFLLGIAVQGMWMHRKPAPLEWSLPGYPRPYLQQLQVKNGNYPELGMATPRDLPLRVAKNVLGHSILLDRVLLRRWINISWMSTLILGPVFLALLGWGYSVWLTGGGLQEWFFAGHETIYLLWPWNLEARFFLSVAPLACLYMWRGGQALILLAKNKPRLLGTMWLPVSLSLTISAWFWVNASWFAKHLTRAGLQGKFSFATWLLSAVLAGWMIWAGSSWLRVASTVSSWFHRELRPLRMSPLRVSQLAGALLVICLIVAGLRAQLQIGQLNRNLSFLATLIPPDVRAGQWIGSHTEANAVIMARNLPTVYHYSQRRMAWFPPSSDAKMLMEGIQRLKVNYLVVIRRENDYYLPPDSDCFVKLIAVFPEAFHLVKQAPDFWVFQTLPPSAAPKDSSATNGEVVHDKFRPVDH